MSEGQRVLPEEIVLSKPWPFEAAGCVGQMTKLLA